MTVLQPIRSLHSLLLLFGTALSDSYQDVIYIDEHFHRIFVVFYLSLVLSLLYHSEQQSSKANPGDHFVDWAVPHPGLSTRNKRVSSRFGLFCSFIKRYFYGIILIVFSHMSSSNEVLLTRRKEKYPVLGVHTKHWGLLPQVYNATALYL